MHCSSNSLLIAHNWLVKLITRPMMGFKEFHSAQRTLAGIEVMAMIKKGQMKTKAGDKKSPAQLFYALAA